MVKLTGDLIMAETEKKQLKTFSLYEKNRHANVRVYRRSAAHKSRFGASFLRDKFPVLEIPVHNVVVLS